METRVVPSSFNNTKNLPPAIASRVQERAMDPDKWIEIHGSGTLRKNKRIGFAWETQYRHERLAYEFGYAFESLPKTQVCYNDAISEGDCHPVTEAGWFIERYMTLSVFSEDRYEVKYIIVEDRDGTRREGIGIIVKQTSFAIPRGNVIFAIVAEYKKGKRKKNGKRKPGKFLPCKNPF